MSGADDHLASLPSVTGGAWANVRAALEATADRFAELVLAVADPQAKATRHWSAADVAAHVATIARLDVSITAAGANQGVPAGLPALAALTTLDTVAALNEAALREFTERDPEILAAWLRADVGRLLAATKDSSPDMPLPWLGGSRLPVAGLLAHLLNELLIHGRDIARASGASWPIPPQDAAWFFELFFVGVTAYGLGHLLETEGAAPAGDLAAEFRSRYTTPVTFFLHDGEVSAGEPVRHPDVRVYFDPPVLALMLFGRISRARAGLTGKIVIWGRRPWRLRYFFRLIHLP